MHSSMHLLIHLQVQVNTHFQPLKPCNNFTDFLREKYVSLERMQRVLTLS